MLAGAVAVSRTGRLWGHAVGGGGGAAGDGRVSVRPAEDGGAVADTRGAEGLPTGYGGPVPVEAELRGGLVWRVSPVLPNDETPLFFGMLEESGLWSAWNGLSPEAAATARVDAVASATYSSRAAIANARAAFVALSGGAADGSAAASAGTDCRTWAAVGVLAAGALLPLFSFGRKRRWRTALQLADVAVLGVWTGFFLSLERIFGWAAGGLPPAPAEACAAALLLGMAFLYPLFGRPSHYCLHACPLGALQELAYRVPVRRRLRLAPALVRGLERARVALFSVLVLCLLFGLWSEWLGWELFGVFAWRTVRPGVAVAAAVVALSAFLFRPYCRFVCPTGTLLKTAESNSGTGRP